MLLRAIEDKGIEEMAAHCLGLQRRIETLSQPPIASPDAEAEKPIGKVRGKQNILAFGEPMPFDGKLAAAGKDE